MRVGIVTAEEERNKKKTMVEEQNRLKEKKTKRAQ
jgi:hypothetical protein